MPDSSRVRKTKFEDKVISNIVTSRHMTSGDELAHRPIRERIVNLLSSKSEQGGPQSVDDICQKLKISNTHSRSALVRLYKKGDIDRIAKGVYRAKGDTREYKKD